MRLLSAHHRVGPFTVGYPLGLLRALPQVKQFEALRWAPSAGWLVRSVRLGEGWVAVVLERG